MQELVQAWKSHAVELREAGDDIMFHLLVKREPTELEFPRFQFVVDNSIQDGRLRAYYPTFVAIIRNKLKNDYFDFEIKLEMTENSEDARFLTNQDRFERLLRKNANLTTLKTLFYLNVE